MNKMNFVINIVNFAIILYCFDFVNPENYDENLAADDEGSKSSLDSESNEIYNGSLNEKPVRERNTGLQSFLNGSDSENKITSLIGDTKCKPMFSNYPYSVSIQKKNSHYASGAFIHKKWILTIASEFYSIRETIKLFRARLGSVNCKKGGALVPLKGIEVHPEYNFNKPSFDLAMLRIGHHVQCSENIRPISLSVIKQSAIRAKFLMTYWSRLIVGGKILAKSAQERLEQNSMRVSYPRIIPWNRCYTMMQTYNHTLDVSSMCLQPIISHHSPCMPDVGAPVIADDGLWGITSGWVSDDCLKHPSPTLFTRISLEPISSWMYTLLDEGG